MRKLSHIERCIDAMCIKMASCDKIFCEKTRDSQRRKYENK